MPTTHLAVPDTAGSRRADVVATTSPAPPGARRYKPQSGRDRGIDGLRAIAVVMVFGVHMVPEYLPGGAVGVDVFFVISGFVITRLLLSEYERTGGLDLRRFYVRRALRLVPTLLVVCAFVLSIGVATDVPDFDNAGTATLLAATYTTNFVRMFAPDSELTQMMGHAWSLAVEEQFYLVWPALLAAALVGFGIFAMNRRVRRQTVLIVVGVFCLLPTVLRVVVWSPQSMDRIYNGGDTRADQLFLGCFLAVVLWCLDSRPEMVDRIRRWTRWLSTPALVTIFAVVATYQVSAWHGERITQGWYTVGFFCMGALAATVVATLVLDGRHPLTRLLGLAPLAWCGRVLSYGAYLWHFPLYFLSAHVGLPDGYLWRPAATVLATLVAAYLTELLVSRPITAWHRRRTASRAGVPTT